MHFTQKQIFIHDPTTNVTALALFPWNITLSANIQLERYYQQIFCVPFLFSLYQLLIHLPLLPPITPLNNLFFSLSRIFLIWSYFSYTSFWFIYRFYRQSLHWIYYFFLFKEKTFPKHNATQMKLSFCLYKSDDTFSVVPAILSFTEHKIIQLNFSFFLYTKSDDTFSAVAVVNFVFFHQIAILKTGITPTHPSIHSNI